MSLVVPRMIVPAYPAAGPSRLLYDTFAGASGTLLTAHSPEVGGTWLDGLGTAKLDGSGFAYGATFNGLLSSHYQDLGTPDIYMVGVFNANIEGNALIARAQDGNDFYVLWRGGVGRLELYRCTAGSFSISKQSAQNVDSATLEMMCYGNTISARAGSAVLTHTVSDLLSETKHGLYFQSTKATAKITSIDVWTSNGTEL